MATKTGKTTDFAVEYWPLDRPRPYPKNARKWKPVAVEKVAASIREFGWRQPLVVDSEGVIIIGHLRLAAALWLQERGELVPAGQVPVHVARDLSQAKVRALRLADNRLHEEAQWDEGLLREDMLDLRGMDLDLSLTGFDSRELDALLLEQSDKADDCPEVPKWAVTKPGDLWLMGEHRLLCGSTTEAANVARLCGGRKIQAVLADPPYGVAYSGGRGCVRKEFENDSLKPEEYGAFLESALRAWDAEIAAKAPLYMWHADRQGEAVYGAIRRAGWKKTAVIIWAKQHFIFSRAVQQYHQQHEPCAYATRETGLANWIGPMNETTLWNVDRPMKSEDHPTQKPVELYRRSLRNSIDRGQIAGEMFLGSGSALIGAEETERILYGTELSSEYCDVIVQRWQNFTGREATLEGHGATFAHVKDGRLREWEDAIKEEVLNAASEDSGR